MLSWSCETWRDTGGCELNAADASLKLVARCGIRTFGIPVAVLGLSSTWTGVETSLVFGRLGRGMGSCCPVSERCLIWKLKH